MEAMSFPHFTEPVTKAQISIGFPMFIQLSNNGFGSNFIAHYRCLGKQIIFANILDSLLSHSYLGIFLIS